MKKSNVVLIVIIAIVVIVALWCVATRNSLVSMEEEVNLKASQIETQLQRRSDLIPNFVATVKGYAAHEEEVYTAIADARSKLSGAIEDDDMGAINEANSELDSALGRLLMVVENYPELKANENFIALQDELAGTENRINKARQDYNEVVASYNKAIKKFPQNIIANMSGFEAADYFEASEGAEKVPTVEF
ncbi:MAG: LemA family protein [Clostridia bacterium]|nr:LemA family protein [Clostridia bacterium]